MAAQDYASRVEDRLQRPPGPAGFDHSSPRFLLAAGEVLVDLLLATVHPDQMDVVLQKMERDVAGGDPVALGAMRLFNHVMSTEMLGGTTTLADEVGDGELPGLIQSTRAAVLSLTAVADMPRIVQLLATLNGQAGLGNKSAMGVLAILETALKDLDRAVVATVRGADLADGGEELEFTGHRGQDGEPATLRADGPFDIEEVDMDLDDVARVDLGTIIVTPFKGLGIQLQVDDVTNEARSLVGVWKNSGLEVMLFAAPASGGLADELREDLIETAGQAGGTAELLRGPFGTEVLRVLPQEGPDGEQFFHVSRTWFAEGPRWLLKGTLLGEAALDPPDDPKVGPFVEFFRNLVVRRGREPMVVGEPLAMQVS